MLIDVEKISSVLEAARDICNTYSDCGDCPFFVEGKNEEYTDCKVYHPHRWDKVQDEWEEEE